MEAYRYPNDYDGISSMAPANPMVALMVSSLWTGEATLKDAASRIPPQKFAIVHKAVVDAVRCQRRREGRHRQLPAEAAISIPRPCNAKPATRRIA